MANNNTAPQIPTKKRPCWKKGFWIGCCVGVVVVIVLDVYLLSAVYGSFLLMDLFTGSGGQGPLLDMGKGVAVMAAVILSVIVLPLLSVVGLIIGTIIDAISKKAA